MDTPPDIVSPAARWPRRTRWLAGTMALALTAGAVLWVERVPLANRAIDETLAALDLAATYRVAEVGPAHVVLTDVVIGDPAHPDLAAARVEIGAGFTTQGIGLSDVVARGVRLNGQWRDGALHFGALDPLINAPSGQPARLPALNLTLTDAVARLSSPWGAAVIRASGQGPLRDGFTGQIRLAAAPIAPGCHGGATQAALALGIRGEIPRLTGPIAIAPVTCGGTALTAARANLDLHVDRALTGGDADLALHLPGGLASTGTRLAGARAGARLTWRGGRLVGVWHGIAAGLASPGVTARRIEAAGGLRFADTLRIEGMASAAGLSPTRAIAGRVAQAGAGLAGTPLAPLGAAFVHAALREGQGASASAAFTLRRGGGHLVVVVPNAALYGRSGAMLLHADRLMLADGALSGHAASGGPGLPRIEAAIDRPADAPAHLSLAMAAYTAGGAQLAIPAFAARQTGAGWQLAGAATLSGPLGQGRVTGLALPLTGVLHGGALALWPRCADIAVQAVTQASLRLGPTRTTVCPAGPGPVLALGPTLRLAARIPALALSGTQAEVPLHASARDLTLTATPAGADATLAALSLTRADSHVAAAHLTAHLAHGAASGTITDGAIATPAARLSALTGDWRFAGAAVDLTAAATLADAASPARFAPLHTADARIHVAGDIASATASLTEPTTGRTVLTLALQHDLATARGHADVTVPGLTFDKALQPTGLSPLALGVIADAKGTLTANARFDWAGTHIASSGSVTTKGLDFAAAFGPVQGLAGTVTFTDLLGLVTPPHQVLTIAAINPGVEVDNGTVAFQMQPGRVLAVEGASWPFLDGQLTLLPTRMTLGAAEERRYELVVHGLDAAKFLVHMNVSNLSATGHFDGDLPLVFDREGNGSIVGGMLSSRPPGGTVSYVGELSYRDLTPIANYAFRTLRSLRYRQMEIGMDGPIAGEIVTRVGMDGIAQGPGAKRNFITRQIARLPIRFNVNIRAPFYQLLGSFRSFFDPTLVADPRSVGLLDAQGHVIAHPSTAVQPPLIAPAPQGAPQ